LRYAISTRLRTSQHKTFTMVSSATAMAEKSIALTGNFKGSQSYIDIFNRAQVDQQTRAHRRVSRGFGIREVIAGRGAQHAADIGCHHLNHNSCANPS
jgi:hypothetical protein